MSNEAPEASQLVITTRLIRTVLPDLTMPEKAVLTYLSTLIGLENNNPNEKTIALMTGCNIKTVPKVLKSLAAKGYLTISRRRRLNIYAPNIKKWMGVQPKQGQRNTPKIGCNNTPKNGCDNTPKNGSLIEVQSNVDQESTITERVLPVCTLKSTPCGYTNIPSNITPTEAGSQATALAGSFADASRRGFDANPKIYRSLPHGDSYRYLYDRFAAVDLVAQN